MPDAKKGLDALLEDDATEGRTRKLGDAPPEPI